MVRPVNGALGWVLTLSALVAACGESTQEPSTPTTGGSAGAPLGQAGSSQAGQAGGASLPSGGGDSGSDGGGAATSGGAPAGGASAGSAGATSAGTAGTGGAAPDKGASFHYSCNLILGIQTTSEWFRQFDDLVDVERWEKMHKDSAHLEKWADPEHEVWSIEKDPVCAQNGESPERVVFMGVEYDYTTVDEFLPDYVAVIENIKAKYPSVQRVDVMTYTRAPNNEECTGADRSEYSWIKPAQDEAIAQLAGLFPGFVFATPKWEVDDCADFNYCPHLTSEANELLAAKLAAYFDGK